MSEALGLPVRLDNDGNAAALAEALWGAGAGFRSVFYVTLGKCSAALQDEAHRIVRAADAPVAFQLFDGKHIMLLLADYLDGVAPPVPSLDLEIESGGGVRTAGVLNRYDSKTDIESSRRRTAATPSPSWSQN